jgi:hypothetical protein
VFTLSVIASQYSAMDAAITEESQADGPALNAAIMEGSQADGPAGGKRSSRVSMDSADPLHGVRGSSRLRSLGERVSYQESALSNRALEEATREHEEEETNRQNRRRQSSASSATSSINDDEDDDDDDDDEDDEDDEEEQEEDEDTEGNNDINQSVMHSPSKGQVSRIENIRLGDDTAGKKAKEMIQEIEMLASMGGRITRGKLREIMPPAKGKGNKKRQRQGSRDAESSQRKAVRSGDRGTRRSSRFNDEEGEEATEGEEDDDDEETKPKYSLRNRERARRKTLNIEKLGGDGGASKRKGKSSYSLRDPDRSRGGGNDRSIYTDPQPRLYLGGKIPAFGSKNRSSPRRRHRRRSDRDDYRSHRRHFDSSSESSGSDSDHSRDRGRYHDRDRRRSKGRGRGGSSFDRESEDEEFSRYEQRRLDKERDSVQPINNYPENGTMNGDNAGMGGMGGMGGSVMDKASKRDLLRADVTPVNVDPSLGFSSVGGLDKHIHALKEMVVLPLLYPDVFSKFDAQPPRGVLFVGPPGTGKTLTARALANSISTTAAQGGRKISFFMRKGADCLSKWVGEGERQLRLLFEQVIL